MSAIQRYPIEIQEFYKNHLIESNEDLLLYSKLQKQKEYLFLQMLMRKDEIFKPGEIEIFNPITLREISLRNWNQATATEELIERIERELQFKNQ